MRIVAIRGENLASLEGSFEVNLEDGVLGQSGLFSITGPTGSGKSTLLDAMCLALYDQMPRLADAKTVYVGGQEDEGDRENAKDVKSIMRRGTGYCRAEVEFIGRDNVRYVAKWEARRARRKPEGRLQNQTLVFQRLDTEEAIGGTKTETLDQIQDRVGLSFDQFRRSVLLAQGDFAAFLKADANERADLLERMTGTEIYSWISKAAFERMRAEEKALDGLVEERKRLEILEDANRANLEGELAGSKVRLAEDREVMKQAGEAVAWYETLAAHGRQVSKGEKTLGEAQKSREEAAPRREVVTRIKEAEQFRSSLEGLDRVVEQRDEAALKRNTASQQETKARLLQESAQKTVGSISYHLVQLGIKAEKSAVGSERWIADHGNIGAIESTWSQSVRDIAALTKKNVALSKEIAKVVQLEPDLDGLSGDALERALAKAIENAQSRLKAARNARDLDDYRNELVDGEPCPLCGSEDHPWAERSPLSNLVGEREALVASLEGVDRQIGKLRPIIADTSSRLADALASIENWEEQVERDHQEFVERLSHKVERYRQEKENQAASSRIVDRVEAIFSAAEREKVAGDEPEAKDEHTGWELEDLVGALKEARGEEADARDRVADASASVRALAEQIKDLKTESEEKATELSRRTSDAGIPVEELRERLANDPRWVTSEEQELDDLEQGLRTAKDVLEERRRLQREHLDTKSPGIPEDEARSEVERVEASIEGLHGKIAELDAALKKDGKARDKAASLDGNITTQRTTTELWQRLGHVIGSADGKKLRKFAQSLTLEALIAHANVHLEDLARRYRLERVPATDMDIQIVDQDMADEIRSVNSLSGGETFLVSLALALGLASLSAREMTVESLFIDEGFGSLDIETLEMALSALESLQATGRQVGIISHVQGLGEHFGAQVVVEKIGAGRSRVLVGEAHR
jgi:exonuclease SbcC